MAVGYHQPQAADLANASQVPSDTSSAAFSLDKPSVDELVATDIAANLAEQTNMPVAPNVANLSVSLTAKSDLAQSTDATTISKPQIAQLATSNRDVVTYVTKAGDTVPSVAASHNVSPETIKWANNLTTDALEPGKSLTILPVSGVTYKVKAGDTIDSIAGMFGADKANIVNFNDLEITGLSNDRQIIVPGGTLPTDQRPGYVAPRAGGAFGGAASGGNSLLTVNSGFHSSTGNGYAYGYCTYYAYERRAELGRPIGGNWGNASSWSAYARASGFLVNHTPEVGAVMQNGGGAGHVAIVEEVLPDGSVVLSEMNYAGGWNRVTRGRTVSAGQAASYNFIH